MRFLRSLVSLATACLVAGLLGGLGLGYLLSRGAGWLTPVPWAIYLVALLAATAAASWVDERRRRLAEAAWPLPPGYALPEDQPAVGLAEVQSAGATVLDRPLVESPADGEVAVGAGDDVAAAQPEPVDADAAFAWLDGLGADGIGDGAVMAAPGESPARRRTAAGNSRRRQQQVVEQAENGG